MKDEEVKAPPPPRWWELLVGSVIGAAWIVFVVGGFLGLWGGK